jgi:HEAT repeat protein
MPIKISPRQCAMLCLVLCSMTVGCRGDRVSGLIADLSDGSVETRRSAARELREQPIVEERAIAALAHGVADSDAEVQRLSIDALGQFGPASKSSLPALKAALKDEDSRVQVRAAMAMRRIDPQDESAVPVLTAAMRKGDGRLLQEVGTMRGDAEWAVPTLVQLLSYESAPLRALAAQTLGRIGTSAGGAKGALERATNDANPAVQIAARHALRSIEVGVGGEARENASGVK